MILPCVVFLPLLQTVVVVKKTAAPRLRDEVWGDRRTEKECGCIYYSSLTKTSILKKNKW